MPKITFLGGGSTVFAKTLLGDILSYPELAGSELCLFDIDPKRLELSAEVGRRVAEKLGAAARIVATTERERALDGADYAISMIQVGGYRPATVNDFEIPKRYGLRQTIGDTVGIGGIMRGLRTAHVMLDMARDMERLCPNVLHLNHVNPMAIVTWALSRASPVRTVGLCHSVQGTIRDIAGDIGVPAEDIDYLCAGINHLAFYLKLERGGVDLYPALHRVIEQGRVPAWNRVRYDVLRRFGYFVTESSEHFSEYVPWYMKLARPDLLERYNIPLDEYPARCRLYEVAWEFVERELERPGSFDEAVLRHAINERGIAAMPVSVEHTVSMVERMESVARSDEYAAGIIHSCETNAPRVIYGNVANENLIVNLPLGCCVEVPCLVDGNGVQPTRVGALPPQLAALMQTNVGVQALTVEAVLTGKREHVYHAAMLDPRTGAELDPEQIFALVDELLEAHAVFLPEALAGSGGARR